MGTEFTKVVVRGHIASVPVPKVFDIITDDSMKETYIVQQNLKLPGTLLSTIISSLNRSTLSNIARDLRCFLQELSKLNGERNRMESIGRPGCFDHGVLEQYNRKEWGGGCMEGTSPTEEFIRWLDNYTPYGPSNEQRSLMNAMYLISSIGSVRASIHISGTTTWQRSNGIPKGGSGGAYHPWFKLH
jgi:hypothetical protein